MKLVIFSILIVSSWNRTNMQSVFWKISNTFAAYISNRYKECGNVCRVLSIFLKYFWLPNIWILEVAFCKQVVIF